MWKVHGKINKLGEKGGFHEIFKVCVLKSFYLHNGLNFYGQLVLKSLCALCISSSQLAMSMQTSNVANIITFRGLLCYLKYYYVSFGSSKICYSSIYLLLILYKNLNQNGDFFVLPMWINCAHWLIFNVFQLNHLNTFNLCVGGLHEVCTH